jgi:serine/threonine protein kinase
MTTDRNFGKKALIMPVYPATLVAVPVPMSATAVLRCGQQVKEALECIHSSGHAHCDVKPSNIFIDSNGKQRLFAYLNYNCNRTVCVFRISCFMMHNILHYDAARLR